MPYLEYHFQNLVEDLSGYLAVFLPGQLQLLLYLSVKRKYLELDGILELLCDFFLYMKT